MTIILNKYFRSAMTREQTVEPGIHTLSPELETYLVINGHAVYVDTAPIEPSPEAQVVDELIAAEDESPDTEDTAPIDKPVRKRK